jgi:serine/threonine-protein kinase
MTLVGQIKGTLGYMAPEQVVSGAPKDHRTDIYALGCMLHCILVGQPPFTGEREAVLMKTAESNVVSPLLQFPERYVPESLNAVVMKATARKPEERYQSVGQLQQDIESYLAGFSTMAEQSGFFREARLFVARNRLPVAITVVALLSFGVMAALFAQYLGRQKMATETERERADQLSTAVETLDLQYCSYVEEALDAKRELARSLALSAGDLRDLAIYERPIATVERVRQMVQTALQQDPDCVQAYTEEFATDCVELNYKAALARPAAAYAEDPHAKYARFACTFPEFDFTSKKRPSIQ